MMLSVDFAHALCLSIILHIAQAADLDDFSNNLATDLGPLLGLFGDNMAKQFLSESTTRWDYLIFALCPIGIITAIVSAIRVRGSTWLKAFIGRGHEGHASVEAELCTSTGRDVSELFNHGAITRVLGKAKLLELIQTPVEDDDIQMSWVLNNDQIPRHMGIFLFQDYLHTSSPENPWKKKGKLAAEHSNTATVSWEKKRKPYNALLSMFFCLAFVIFCMWKLIKACLGRLSRLLPFGKALRRDKPRNTDEEQATTAPEVPLATMPSSSPTMKNPAEERTPPSGQFEANSPEPSGEERPQVVTADSFYGLPTKSGELEQVPQESGSNDSSEHEDDIERVQTSFSSLNLPMPTSENTSEKTRSSTCRQRSDNVIYSPNISLNVGRKETKSAAFYGVAICGVILQAGLIGMAVCFTWIWTGFDDESTATRLATQAEIREAIKWKEVWFYAFGTVTLCCGLYWCAALIGGSTLEEIYVRETGGKSPPRSNDQSRSPGPRLYWIQPGGQTIGDQTFDAFAYADIDKPLKKYVTSRKKVERVFHDDYILLSLGKRGKQRRMTKAFIKAVFYFRRLAAFVTLYGMRIIGLQGILIAACVSNFDDGKRTRNLYVPLERSEEVSTTKRILRWLPKKLFHASLLVMDRIILRNISKNNKYQGWYILFDEEVTVFGLIRKDRVSYFKEGFLQQMYFRWEEVELGNRGIGGQLWLRNRLFSFETQAAFASILTLAGYVLQFIALRGMSAYISIAQLVATILMSIFRGLLRMRHQGEQENQLNLSQDRIVGHELDWLAIRLYKAYLHDTNMDINAWPIPKVKGRSKKSPEDLYKTQKSKALGAVWYFHVLGVVPAAISSSPVSIHKRSRLISRLLSYRTRLAHLTSHRMTPTVPSQQMWSDEQVRVRTTAHNLSNALCRTLDILLCNAPNEIKCGTVALGVGIRLTWNMDQKIRPRETSGWRYIPFKSTSDLVGHSWRTDPAYLEAVLGLWLWSLELHSGAKRKRSGLASNRADDNDHARIATCRNDNWGGALVKTWEEYFKEHDLTSPIFKKAHIRLHHFPKLRPRMVYLENCLSEWKQKDPPSDVFEHVVGDYERVMHSQLTRFFGWSTINNYLQEYEERIKELSGDGLRVPIDLEINYLMSDTGIIKNLCQELYGALLSSAKRGGLLKYAKYSEGDQVPSKHLVKELGHVFVQAGLGSATEALLCILPALLTKEAEGPEDEDAIIKFRDVPNQQPPASSQETSPPVRSEPLNRQDLEIATDDIIK